MATWNVSPSTGLRRRTTAGKHWLVIIQQDETAKAEMLQFATKREADRVCVAIGGRFAPEVHFVEEAHVESAN